SELTEREQEIIKIVLGGTNSPSKLAEKLRISQSGASQALQKLAGKGRLVRRKAGRSVKYETLRQKRDTELFFLSQAYNSLSQVWACIMSMSNLSAEEMRKAREARDLLEKILAKKGKEK
ncbi:MAG: helix-turn-helix domain-containing protein, partial [Nitrososphaerales archaeon]